MVNWLRKREAKRSAQRARRADEDATSCVDVEWAVLDALLINGMSLESALLKLASSTPLPNDWFFERFGVDD